MKSNGAVFETNKPAVHLDFKIAGFLIFLILGLVVGITTPWLPELSILGHRVVMAIIITLGLWIFKPMEIPFSVAGFLMMTLFLFFGVAPADVFSGFTSNATWVLIPALFFGYVLIKTGLGKRIAFQIIKLFKPTFGGMVKAWLLIGIVLALLTPSITVRMAITIPIAFSCVQVMRFEPGSGSRGFIMLTTFAMAMIPGSGWLTGSLTGPILQGMYDAIPELNGVLNFQSYLRVGFLPMELACVIMIILTWLFLKPKEKVMVSKEEFMAEFESLPPISKNEIYAGIILVFSFILFFTTSITHIPEPAICLFVIFLFSVGGIIKAPDINKGISWDLAVFIGISIGLGAVTAKTGISDWIGGIVIPALKPLVWNPMFFTLSIAIIMFAWRFIDVARLVPTQAILVPILPQISETYGISPMVWVPIFSMAVNCFFMGYLNIWALQAESLVPEKTWTAKQMFNYSSLYALACIIALAITVPYWISIGLF